MFKISPRFYVTRTGVSAINSQGTEAVGYSENRYSVDPDDGKSTSGHIFYLGESSSKQDMVALSSCKA